MDDWRVFHVGFILPPSHLWVGYFRTHGSEDTTKNKQRRTNSVSNTVDGSTDSLGNPVVACSFPVSSLTKTTASSSPLENVCWHSRGSGANRTPPHRPHFKRSDVTYKEPEQAIQQGHSPKRMHRHWTAHQKASRMDWRWE